MHITTIIAAAIFSISSLVTALPLEARDDVPVPENAQVHNGTIVHKGFCIQDRNEYNEPIEGGYCKYLIDVKYNEWSGVYCQPDHLCKKHMEACSIMVNELGNMYAECDKGKWDGRLLEGDGWDH